MNFDPDDISRSTLLRDRQKIGSSLADVDPMNIDKSVDFTFLFHYIIIIPLKAEFFVLNY